MEPALVDKVGHQEVGSKTGTGTALYNLNQRLTGLYDQKSALQITSSKNGTEINVSIPYKLKEETHENISS